MKIFVLLVLFFSCNKKEAHKAYLVKQWHLSPSQNTLNIEKSKSIPQFKNQKDIYQKLERMILNKETSIVLAEGCGSGEINQSFLKVYNGWTMDKLKDVRDSSEYDDIMAPVQMKIKAKYPRVRVLCADDEKLIKKNLLAFSEVRGQLNFYQALKKYKKKSVKKYDQYAQKLRELYPDTRITNPLEFTLKEAIRNVDLFESLIIERNASFINNIKNTIHLNPTLIVGGLHVENLSNQLNSLQFTFKTITPDHYNNEEQMLLLGLKKILNKESKSRSVFYQVPESFDVELFKTSKLINDAQIFDKDEKKEVSALAKIADINFDLLKSDYDGDGIRDFTISKGDNIIVISAEDSDWDNDGIPNVIDSTLGDNKITRKEHKFTLGNKYLSQASISEVKKWFNQKGINLGTSNEVEHELLVLDIFRKVSELKSLKRNRVLNIRSVNSKISYGDQVFFSYIKQSRTLEYYPKKLEEYLVSIQKKFYKGHEYSSFISGYVVPLIVHSISHEIIHSFDVDVYPISKKLGWTWSTKQYNGSYLFNARLESKKISIIRSDFRFKNKTYHEWKKLIENYPKNKSFLIEENIASIYSLQNPSEWFAENYAMCVFKEIYPNSISDNKINSYISYLGINPRVSNLCHSLE
jgi:hypothetical protein